MTFTARIEPACTYHSYSPASEEMGTVTLTAGIVDCRLTALTGSL